VVALIHGQYWEIWRECQMSGWAISNSTKPSSSSRSSFPWSYCCFFFEKFKGLCLVFLLVTSSPIFNNFDDPSQHGEEGDCTGFFNNTSVDVKDLVCALAIASGTKEYARERARAHTVGNGWIIVGFDVGSKVGLAVFSKLSEVALCLLLP
jgi:hypothetical protein